MQIALYVAALVGAPVLGYYLGIFTGAPYVATERDRVERMLDLAQVGPGTAFADLGSGDGRLVIAAAKRGAQAVGYEINPLLVYLARRAARKAEVARSATFVCGNFRSIDFAPFEVVSVYGVSSLMRVLETKFEHELKPGARVVSNVFALPHWIGQSDDGLYVYEVQHAEPHLHSKVL